MPAKGSYRVVLDDQVPLGELRAEKTVVLVNPDSDLESVLRMNPGVKLSMEPRETEEKP